MISEGTKKETLEKALKLEKEAHEHRNQHKNEEAFHQFDEAALLYREAGEPLKAAFCFASAATCWNIRTGWQPMRNSATRSHSAADEAMKAGHFDYARSLYRDAALLYEKEGDSENVSQCFWGSQTAEAKHCWAVVTHRKDQGLVEGFYAEVKVKDRAGAFIRFLLNSLNRIAWGYGEKPFRTFGVALCVIFGSAFFYASSSHVLVNGTAKAVSFFEALYFSFITFATVGYGDYLPSGWLRIVAVCEALSGIFLAPLFLVALTRRYLRMYK